MLRTKPAWLLPLVFSFLFSTFCFLGEAAADPAEVGRTFAGGGREDLKELKLMDEVRRLADIDRPYQAEALIHQALKTYPLHPEALTAVDFMINQVAEDRSVPDDDRVEALRQACQLGVRTAQVWVEHYKEGEEAAQADYKRIEYEFRMTEDYTRHVQNLTAFLKKHESARIAGNARRKLAVLHMETGRFDKAIEVFEEMMKAGAQVQASLLGRCYYETGDFEKALTYMTGESWRGRSMGVDNWRDLLARLHFHLGNAAKGMELVGEGALVRKSDIFVHVETDWQEIPRYRKVDRALEVPPGAEWIAEVTWRLQVSYTCDSPDLLDGRPVHAGLNMILQVEPLSVPKGTTEYALSVSTPVALETMVPYGMTSSQTTGYRTTWPGELVTTADDWVKAPKVWAQSRRGVLKRPPCRVWRTCRVLEDNRVQVDIYLSSAANSLVTVDNRQALVDEPLGLPENAQVVKNRTISMEVAPSGDGLADRRPDKPVCSYVARCFQEVKVYLPTVTVIQRFPLPGDNAEVPPARTWRWDIGGHVLELESSRPVWVRKISVAPSFRYVLNEIVEAAP